MPVAARTIIDQFPSPAAVLEGPDHVYVATSAAYRRILGGRNPVGQSIRDVVPGVSESGALELLDRVYETGEPVSGTGRETRFDSDGDGIAEQHFIDFSYHPIRNEQGEVRAILAHVTEVTERVRRERRQEFLVRATEVLFSSLDYRSTLTALTKLAVPEIADWAAIDVVGPDGELRRIAVAHVDPEKVRFAVELQERYPPDPNAPRGVHQVLRTGVAEYLEDIPDELLVAATRSEEHLELARALGLRSYVCVPLIARGATLGALTLVAAESGRRYGPDDVRFAEDVATRAAIAIDNARLFGESEESRLRTEEIAMELEAQTFELQAAQVELETTNEELELRAEDAERAQREAEIATVRLAKLQAVGNALADVIDVRHVAQLALEQAVSIFQAGTATMVRMNAEGTELEMVHSLGLSPDLVDAFRTFPVEAQLPLSDAIRDRKPVYLGSEEERAARYSELVRTYPQTSQKSWAAIPMIVEGRVLGGMSLGFPTPREFAAGERSFLEALAQQCAQAFDRARLFEAERQARERMEILADAGVLVASSLDVDRTLSELSHLVVPRIADWCFVEVPTPEGRIELAAVHHRRPEMIQLATESLKRYPVDPNAPHGTGHVMRTGEPELASNVPEEFFEAVAQSDEHREILRRAGIHSYLSVPLSVRGSVLGVLSLVMSDSRRRFSRDDLPFALELARRAAMAIENARLYAAERSARTEAEEANKAKTEFLSAMSHELRTPLNAIAGYVDLLDLGIHGPLTDAQRESVERIKRNQQILLGLISDVLNFARMEAGRIEFSAEPVPVETLLSGLDQVIGPQVRSKNLSYQQSNHTGDLVAFGDPDRIQQIMLNLVTNAIKFTDPGGSIAVSAEGDANRIVIRVSDTGRGIPRDKLDAVFDPFVQIDRHRTEQSQQGVGLGLAISRELARAMGGDLLVESEAEQGSTFTVILPREQDKDGQNE